jgi:rod shape-determining protein MreC
MNPLKLLQRYRELLTVSVLLLWPLVGYLTKGHRGREPNFIDRTVLWVTTPVQSGLTIAVSSLADGMNGYVALRGAHEDANECRVTLSQTQAEANSLREMEAENLRLKAMLNYSEASVDQEIVARVIGMNPSAQFLSIRINRGEDDGVHVGMPVVTPDGAVGHIVRAVGNSADVMLVADPLSRIGGVVQRSRVRVTAVGTGNGHELKLEVVRKEDDVKDGDIVVTAGSDGIFPRGVKLGTLRAPERPAVGMFLHATLDPSVDFSRVEEVMVIPVTMGIPSASLGKVMP